MNSSRKLKIFAVLFGAFFFAVFIALSLLVPVVRWMMVVPELVLVSSWQEFFRIIGYSVGISLPAAILLWIEGRASGRW